MNINDNFQVEHSTQLEFDKLFDLATQLHFSTSLVEINYSWMVFYFETRHVGANNSFRVDKNEIKRGPEKSYKEAVKFLEDLLGLDQKQCSCELYLLLRIGCQCNGN